jgi:hypothetical protein
MMIQFVRWSPELPNVGQTSSLPQGFSPAIGF